MTSLCRRRCRPISSALWWRARSRFTPWTQALECTTRTWPLPRERHVVAPCRPHRGAAPQLRLVVGRYAATAARYAARLHAAAPNHDVATTWCRYAAQVWDTRPKLLYETQVGVGDANITVLLDCSKSSRQCSLSYLLTN